MPNPLDIANPFYNVNNGQQLGQYYAQQRGPGDVVFGDPAATGGTTPPPTNTPTPTPTTGGPTSTPGYFNGVYAGSDPALKAQAYFNNSDESTTGGWNNGIGITGNQAWQNFKFDNPEYQWQKNFNMIDNPLDRFRYAFDTNTGGSIGHNITQQAMIKAGIDPAVAHEVFNVVAGYAGNKAAGLGLDQGWNNSMGNMFQLGSQLWGQRPSTTPGGRATRYLIKDFGAGNFENANLLNYNRPGNPGWNGTDPQLSGGGGGQGLADWYSAYERDNSPSWYGNSPGGNNSPNATANAALEAGWTPQNQGVGLDGAAAAARLANGTGGNANLIRGLQGGTTPAAVTTTQNTNPTAATTVPTVVNPFRNVGGGNGAGRKSPWRMYSNY